MNKKMLSTALMLAFFTSYCFCQEEAFSWPGGTKAAVCLSYDDAIETHLNIAIPDLDAAGIRGTFYIQGNHLQPDNMDHWRKAAARGHELGNHSLFHPCTKDFDWMRTEYVTEGYTVRQILEELSVMNAFLYSLDGKQTRTYAYPCTETIVGGVDYVDTLRTMGYFNGARVGGDEIPASMKQLDLFRIPSRVVIEEPADDLIAYCEEAARKGTLAVYMFHGVGGQYLKVSREAHQGLVDYLSAHSDTYWVAPLAEIVTHIESEVMRLGWKE